MSLVLFLVAAQALAAPDICRQPNIVCNPAPDAEREPDVAVDHETVRSVTPITGHPGLPRTITVIRSGSRYRSEGRAGTLSRTGYTDLGSKFQVEIARNASGRYEAVSVRGPGGQGAHAAFLRTKTGERDRLLGESCDVWATQSADPNPYQSTWLTCLTADGIELWTRIRSANETREYSRTVSIRRRRVAASEVTPPRDFLELKRWEGYLAAVEPSAGSRAQATGHEVRLERAPAAERASEASLVLRWRDSWRYYQTTRTDGSTSWHIHHLRSGFSFQATQLATGELQHLDAAVDPQAQQLFEDLRGPSRGKTDEILRETCTWHDTPYTVSHSQQQDCLTADGILLARERRTRFGTDETFLRAVRLRRHAPSLRSVLPPTERFNLDALWRKGE